MKSLQSLAIHLLNETGEICCTQVDRDIETLCRRVDGEGDSFLTITLPAFGKDFERCLDLGHVDTHAFPGFRRREGLPVFLRGCLIRVFDTNGSLLSDPDADAIRAIRQFCLAFSKIFRLASESRNAKALRGYCETEVDLKDLRYDIRHAKQVFDAMFRDTLNSWERELFALDLEKWVPRHGPGATADRLAGNDKWTNRLYSERLDAVFPAIDMLIPNARYTSYLNETFVNLLSRDDEPPSRVVLVPKTAKTPRVIAIEPAYKQYAQQAVLARIMASWREDDLFRSLVGFDDQLPNQELARQGSLDGSLATLDLSEASDRVSAQLVFDLLEGYPHVLEVFHAIRSERADVPGHGVIPLLKYASMGSAVTFPLEAMVFLTVALSGIVPVGEASRTRAMARRLVGSMRIFGDDIIVPVDSVHSVIESLETFGFRVNYSKSFWTGRFRESCGGDFYAGSDVTPARLKQPIPQSLTDVESLTSFVAFRNHLYYRGYWATCRELDRHIVSLLRRFPIVADDSPALGRSSYLRGYHERMHPTLHKPLVKAWVRSDRTPLRPLDGVDALTKRLVLGPIEDPDHLTKSGRPERASMKLRWVDTFDGVDAG